MRKVNTHPNLNNLLETIDLIVLGEIASTLQ